MEEIVWILIGVIGILIMVGAVATVYQQSMENGKVQAAQQSATSLGAMCDKVCKLPKDTYLSSTASLPSGSVVNAADDRICISYEDNLYCGRCGCQLDPYTLDLNNTEARKLFRTHNYECYFRRGERMGMECKG